MGRGRKGKDRVGGVRKTDKSAAKRAGGKSSEKWCFTYSQNGTGSGSSGVKNMFGGSQSGDSLGTTGTVVREALQNSYDARAYGSAPVRVSFRVVEMRMGDIPGYYDYVKYVRLAAQGRDERQRKDYAQALRTLDKGLEAKVDVLVISDYGTTGAKGAAWRNLTLTYGISEKDVSSGGSYGLGKAVFLKLSRIGMVVFSTLDMDGGSRHRGYADLPSLELEKGVTTGPAVYGRSDARTGRGGLDIPGCSDLPCMGERTEPGTDVAIIDPEPSSGGWVSKKAKFAALEVMLKPLYDGNIEITITDDRPGKRTSILLNRDTLPMLVREIRENLANSGRANYADHLRAISDRYDMLEKLNAAKAGHGAISEPVSVARGGMKYWFIPLDTKHTVFEEEEGPAEEYAALTAKLRESGRDPSDYDGGNAMLCLKYTTDGSSAGLRQTVTVMRSSGMALMDHNLTRVRGEYSAMLMLGDGALNDDARLLENPAHDRWDPSAYAGDVTLGKAIINWIDGWMTGTINHYVQPRGGGLQSIALFGGLLTYGGGSELGGDGGGRGRSTGDMPSSELGGPNVSNDAYGANDRKSNGGAGTGSGNEKRFNAATTPIIGGPTPGEYSFGFDATPGMCTPSGVVVALNVYSEDGGNNGRYYPEDMGIDPAAGSITDLGADGYLVTGLRPGEHVTVNYRIMGLPCPLEPVLIDRRGAAPATVQAAQPTVVAAGDDDADDDGNDEWHQQAYEWIHGGKDEA